MRAAAEEANDPGACPLSTFEDGGRSHRHHGEDLRALRVKPREGADQSLQGGSSVLYRNARAPLRRVGDVSQLARGDDRPFGQCLYSARRGSQFYVPPKDVQRAPSCPPRSQWRALQSKRSRSERSNDRVPIGTS